MDVFEQLIIGERSVSKRDRNEDRDACSTHFSIEASPRASCPLGWPNKTNAFLMDRGQTRAAPLALVRVVLGRVHAWLCAHQPVERSLAQASRDRGTKIYRGADGNESEEVVRSTPLDASLWIILSVSGVKTRFALFRLFVHAFPVRSKRYGRYA